MYTWQELSILWEVHISMWIFFILMFFEWRSTDRLYILSYLELLFRRSTRLLRTFSCESGPISIALCHGFYSNSFFSFSLLRILNQCIRMRFSGLILCKTNQIGWQIHTHTHSLTKNQFYRSAYMLSIFISIAIKHDQQNICSSVISKWHRLWFLKQLFLEAECTIPIGTLITI